MSNNEHIYAVARIKAKEVNLLDSSTIEQLISASSLEAMNKILKDRGWGDGSDNDEDMLSVESDKIWTFISEIIQDLSVFDTLRVERDFHNIKVAIKSEFSKNPDDSIYQKYGSVSIKNIKEMMAAKDTNFIPEYMQKYADKAYRYMMKTGDSQLCDTVLDKGALEVMIMLSEKSGNRLLKEYAQTKAAISNIKIAIRGAKTKKTKDFFDRALVKCDGINIENLSNAAVQGIENVYSYLETTSYSSAIDLIKSDLAAFECWCDNQIMKSIKKEKYTSTTISPIVAYILARENEIKTVRILTVAKRNNLALEEVKKRMRDMYV